MPSDDKAAATSTEVLVNKHRARRHPLEEALHEQRGPAQANSPGAKSAPWGLRRLLRRLRDESRPTEEQVKGAKLSKT
jgi:hypothetical protein